MNEQNPYSTGGQTRDSAKALTQPSSIPEAERKRLAKRLRIFGEFIFVILTSVVARSAVYWGDHYGLTDFNIKDGFWGTKFLGKYLYAYDEDAIHVVGCLYFIYGLIGSCVIIFLARVFRK